MKRAPIVEDWSRFNRAVLEVADGRAQPGPRRQSVARPPERETVERGDEGDKFGLIVRQKWRKRAL